MLKSQLPTPSLVINRGVLEKNLKTMARFAQHAGVKLRPHIKTHKNVTIAKLQVELGAIGVTCATVSEAELMHAGGINDIFIAYPLLGDYQLTKAAQLNKECQLTLGFDSAEAARRWSKWGQEQQTTFQLVMIINTGGNRDGVLPSEARALAESIRQLPNISLVGVMTHEGHLHQSPDTPAMLQAARKAGQELVLAAENVREAGFEIPIVSSGSSPACQGQTQVDGVTEWRPGTYALNDLNEMKYIVGEADCALRVLTTVVSNPAPGRFILDAGSKVLSEAKTEFGHGFLPGVPEARIVRVNEEHGVVEAQPNALCLGQRVEVIPVHVCTVVNLSNGYYLEQEDGHLEFWSVDARGLVW